MSKRQYQNDEEQLVSLIASEPNTFLLDRVCKRRENRIEIRPLRIIAWKVITWKEDDFRFVQPITYEEVSDLWCDEILWPNGTVTDREGIKCYPSLQAFIDSEKAKYPDPTINVIDTTIFNRAEELGKQITDASWGLV